MHEPIISVGILSAKKISFTLFGDFQIGNQTITHSGICHAELKDGAIVCFVNNVRLAESEKITFSPSNPESEYFTLKDVIIGSKFHWEKKEKQSFKGSITLLVDHQIIHAINNVSLEEYLKSVISSEMSPKCSLGFLKAHAIISRSWVLSQIEKREKSLPNLFNSTESTSAGEVIKWYDREEHQHFDVCADDHCQRYQGTTKIHTTTVDQAIDNTAGLVLTYKNNICDARFSKCCGGRSESFENVWANTPHEYLTPVIDYKFEPDEMELDLRIEKNSREWIKSFPKTFCNTNEKRVLEQILPYNDQSTKDFFRWSVTYTQSKLSSLIKEKTGMDLGSIIDLIPVERGHSGRIIKLKIVGSSKSIILGKELEIRKALSQTHLYSSAFFVEKSNLENGIAQTFKFNGAGWGHGVGLCQIGAAVMAEQGYNFDEILLHYYKNAKIVKIY